MLFYVYLGEECLDFFPAGPFFSVFQIKCLLKCPYFKEPPLPWKIPGYAPEFMFKFLINMLSLEHIEA